MEISLPYLRSGGAAPCMDIYHSYAFLTADLPDSFAEFRRAPELVGDFVRFFVKGVSALTLTHDEASDYGHEKTQVRMKQFLELGATGTCLCILGGVPMNFFYRDGKYQVAAVSRLGHLCRRHSKGAHPKGDQIRPIPPVPLKGVVSCHAHLPLTVLNARAADPRKYGQDATVGDPRYISPTTLLRMSFEQAHWHLWKPEAAKLPAERWFDMQLAAKKVWVNGSSFESAVTVLSAAGTLNVDELTQRLSVNATSSRIPLRYVLSQAMRLTSNPGVEHLWIRGISEPLPVPPHIGEWLETSERRSSCRLRATMNLDDSTVVVLAGLFQNPSGVLTLHSIAPHLMSPQLVPAESRYEARAEEDAVRRGLTFERSFANVPGADFPCDLIIHLDGYRIYVEVWGMDNPAYNEQRADKVVVYRRLGLILAEWDALKQRRVPNMRELAQGALMRWLKERAGR